VGASASRECGPKNTLTDAAPRCPEEYDAKKGMQIRVDAARVLTESTGGYNSGYHRGINGWLATGKISVKSSSRP
jgi:hypothetical protein